MRMLVLAGSLLLVAGCACGGADPDATAAPEPMPKRPATRVTPEKTDSDHDGVPNETDLCPGTGHGTPVDRRGCAVTPAD